MKNFFRQILATVLGIFVAFILLIGFVLALALVKTRASQANLVHKNSVLHIPLKGTVVENSPLSVLKVLERDEKGLIDLVNLKKAIQAAQNDPDIKGIYLEVGPLIAGWASVAEIRSALASFKKTGKFIIAYGEAYTNKTYYIASLADDIILHPYGEFAFKGLSITVFFYKNLLDRLGIIPEIFRVGKYKAAVEPFTSQAMSLPNKEQNYILLKTIYEHMLQQIAESRKLSVAALKRIAQDLSLVYPKEVYKASLVTELGYADSVEATINHKLGLKADKDIHYVPFNEYQSKRRSIQEHEEQIAVLVASGDITNELNASGVASKSFAKMLSKLRKDPKVKAIVLRINSPGGSALASETIWKELMLTKAVKPIVASMADVAASGGYYIATACQYIVAHPMTITGSIGIYSLYFDIDTFLQEKIGITRDGVKTNPSADLYSIFRPLTRQEKDALQQHVEHGYKVFLNRVAQGRKIKPSTLNRLAEGRVWPGILAKEHGLVDELGGLQQAIDKAAELAGIEDNYTLVYWPKYKVWLTELVSEWKETENKQLINLAKKLLTRLPDNQLNLLDKAWEILVQNLKAMQGVQARLPYTIEID
jgi:protease-4